MKKILKDLLTSVDVLNTLGGGVTEPIVSVRQGLTGHEMRIRVPGISKESMNVEVHNNELSVFYLIPIQSNEQLIQMPRAVYHQNLPYFIDVKGIKADYEGNELVIKLPFNELSNGYNKKIRIGGE
jgi:HSP20 family molecular chaperone IbpA